MNEWSKEWKAIKKEQEVCAKMDLKDFKVAIDFDGCMVHHPFGNTVEDYQSSDMIPVPDAIDWCLAFNSIGIKLILWTSRGTQSFLHQAIEYMESNGIKLFGVNDNEHQKSWSDSPKVHAHVYVDDNGLVPLCYPIPEKRGVVNWKVVGPMVLNRFRNKEKFYS